ncbi:hypothetical protein CC86DRAFT_72004 [Ophiobolus disseminans]|uniref:Uncharacterized protein n=1 Tax=Ophiobolus disseminans TaxID=1469910 RepID=A0A6A6ZNX0_9PLEO|nr:hypothetical protein CC86DRAFT_72004 [Ophiobolus disseminans]
MGMCAYAQAGSIGLAQMRAPKPGPWVVSSAPHGREWPRRTGFFESRGVRSADDCCMSSGSGSMPAGYICLDQPSCRCTFSLETSAGTLRHTVSLAGHAHASCSCTVPRPKIRIASQEPHPFLFLAPLLRLVVSVATEPRHRVHWPVNPATSRPASTVCCAAAPTPSRLPARDRLPYSCASAEP